jgi:hypothetical protein
MTAIVLLVAALALAGPAAAADLVWDTQVAASGTGSEIPVVGHVVLNFMVCGTGFSGTVTVRQGPATASMLVTKTLTLALYTGCAEYYTLYPSSLIRVDFTRSAGTLNQVWVEHWR